MKTKRILFVLLAVVIACAFAFSVQAEKLKQGALIPKDPNRVPTSVKPEATNTLLSAITAEDTTGTAVDLGFTVSQFAVQVSYTGTYPTRIQLLLEGSLDGTTYRWIDSQLILNSDSSDWLYFVTGKPVRYIRGHYLKRDGGGADTAITMKVTAGGN